MQVCSGGGGEISYKLVQRGLYIVPEGGGGGGGGTRGEGESGYVYIYCHCRGVWLNNEIAQSKLDIAVPQWTCGS